MTFMIRFRSVLPLLAAALFAVGTLGFPTQARATFRLTISDGTANGNVTVTHNNNNVQNGSITYSSFFDPNAPFPDFQIQITTGVSAQSPSVADLSITNMQFSTQGFTGTRTLTFTLENTGFTAPTGTNLNLTSELHTTVLPQGSATLTYQSFLGPDSSSLTPGTLVTNEGSAVNAVSIASTPFTLRSVTTMTITGTGSFQTVVFHGVSTVTVPAPAGVMLALTGLPVFGVGYMLRRRKKA
jgi:hypothetical protein